MIIQTLVAAGSSFENKAVLSNALLAKESELAKFLIKAGANPETRNPDGSTAFRIACYTGQLDILEAFIENGFVFNLRSQKAWELLVWCSQVGSLEALSFLLYLFPEQHSSIFVKAAKEGLFLILRNLLNTDINLNTRDSEFHTALMWATYHEHVDIVSLLLEAGADPNVTDGHGRTAMYWASHSRDRRILGLLCSKVKPRHFRGRILLYAVSQNLPKFAEFLLRKGIDVNLQNESGTTALIMACDTEQIGFVKILLDSGARTEIRTNTGYTALMSASETGNLEVVNLLLDSGADPHARDNQGRNALMLASIKGRREIVKRFTELGVASQ